ncbi:MAG: hypothetical protein AAB627_01795 [Patescibacteria group bacterium]
MILRFDQTKLDKDYLAVRPYKVTAIEANFSELIVNKPWGNEYLVYRNSEVEVWNLFIKQSEATSMHCHPNKKTALVVLDGKARLSSLNESIELLPMSAAILDPGVFHSTQAVSPGGVRILEFETPPMKHDIIRLEDRYGRANKGYEGLKEMETAADLARFSVTEVNITKNFGGKNICIKTLKNGEDSAEINREKIGLAVILGGRIVSRQGDVVYGPVDILEREGLGELDKAVLADLCLLTIKRVSPAR